MTKRFEAGRTYMRGAEGFSVLWVDDCRYCVEIRNNATGRLHRRPIEFESWTPEELVEFVAFDGGILTARRPA